MFSQYLNNKDVSLFSLSKQFNVSPPTLKKLFIKEEIPLKTLRDYRKIYELNEHFFDVIDNEEKAYWLGFLYADGVINEEKGEVRINLAKTDEAHLAKFRDSLKSTHPIKETSKKTKKKTYYGAYIGFNSYHMTKQLAEKGCFQNKSLELMFPTSETVPDNLIHHFIRGYFDGDGCITYTIPKGKYYSRRLYKISMLGTENMLENIKHFLNSGVKVHKEKGKQVYAIYLSGNQQCKRIFKYLYNDATIFLDRKHKRFQTMLQYMEDNPYNEAWNKGNKHLKNIT